MRKALKELILEAELKTKGYFSTLLFVSDGGYDGFFGPNGYDSMLVLGISAEDGMWYRIGKGHDVFYIYKTNGSFNLDIPSEYGVPRIWFDRPIYIDNDIPISTLTGDFREEYT